MLTLSVWVDFANLKNWIMSKEVEIIISEMQLNGTTAIRIMKCLKEHEPEIWHELKETLKQKLPIHDVSKTKWTF